MFLYTIFIVVLYYVDGMITDFEHHSRNVFLVLGIVIKTINVLT